MALLKYPDFTLPLRSHPGPEGPGQWPPMEVDRSSAEVGFQNYFLLLLANPILSSEMPGHLRQMTSVMLS